MEIAKDIMNAARVTNVVKLASLDEDYFPDGASFSLFLNPTETSTTAAGETVVIEAMLAHSDGKYVEVPVIVGDWSPIVCRALQAGSIDLDEFDVYVGLIHDVVL